MANVGLTCVIRKGLRLPEGLLAAQASHISDQWMRERILDGKPFTEEEMSWMKTPYIAILQVDTLEELKAIYSEAQTENLNPVVWKDTIHSIALNRFIPDVMVGISLGPADADKVKVVTGKLKLYQ